MSFHYYFSQRLGRIAASRHDIVNLSLLCRRAQCITAADARITAYDKGHAIECRTLLS